MLFYTPLSKIKFLRLDTFSRFSTPLATSILFRRKVSFSCLLFRKKYFSTLVLSSEATFKSSSRFTFYYPLHKASFNMPPKGIKHDWRLNVTGEELLKRTDDLINRCKKLYDQVASVPDSEVSYETVLKVLNDSECDIKTERYFLDSPQHFATDTDLSAASTKSDQILRDFADELSMRSDVYKKLLLLQERGEVLEHEPKRYLDFLILIGKRNGVHLSEDVQKRIKELKSKLNKLCVDFTKNLNDVQTTLEFTDEELNGLPSDFLSSLKRNPDNGKAIVTLKYPHFFPIMKGCKVPETRKQLNFAFNTQCLDENGQILEELRKARHELATLLGYASHADYCTEILMSKNAQNVHKFLTDLSKRLQPLWLEEKEYLLGLKKNDCAELNIPFDGELNTWDMAYYLEMAEEKKYSVDHTKLKEYFPLPVVKKGLLEIYQDLFGLKFDQIEGEYWHEDVELFSVQDAATGELLGYFFLDLFPRPNKYNHAALFELQHGFRLQDGTRQVAVGAMLANFSKPRGDQPALMEHSEVKTFFHEFGHVVHYLCIRSRFPRFYIMDMETDFIEAPSQMLENWVWESESLKKMSSHYKDSSLLPDDLINSLVKSRLANIGYSCLRQVTLSLFDQKIHTSPEGNSRQIYDDIAMDIIGIKPQEGTHFACHFGHLAGDYDARYYGYLWSEVYSMDMFKTRFGTQNLLNSAVGKDYRKKILEPGATKDARELIKDFLGREPNQEAFLKSKGLS